MNDLAAPGVWVLGAFPTYMTDLTQYLPYAFGTGTSASFWAWSFANLKLTAQPKLTKVGERLYMDLEFSMLQDASFTPAGGETAAELDFAALLKATLFMVILAFGLAYAWRRGALEWR